MNTFYITYEGFSSCKQLTGSGRVIKHVIARQTCDVNISNFDPSCGALAPVSVRERVGEITAMVTEECAKNLYLHMASPLDSCAPECLQLIGRGEQMN